MTKKERCITLTTGAMVVKRLLVNDKEAKLAGALVRGKPLQLSLIFSSKNGAYLSGAPFRCSPLE